MKIVFITIDGRSKISRGMTAKECQELLRNIEKILGIKIEFSVNLDGGGSTTMVVLKKIINVILDKYERRIGTFIYVKKVIQEKFMFGFEMTALFLLLENLLIRFYQWFDKI